MAAPEELMVPDLSFVARDIDALLKQPAIVYGSEPADARDIDLLLLRADPGLDERLHAAGWRRIEDRWVRTVDGRLVALDVDVAAAADACAGVAECQLADMFDKSVPLNGYQRLFLPSPPHRLLLMARQVTVDPGPIATKRLQRARRALADDASALETAKAVAPAWGCEARLRVLQQAVAREGRVSIAGAVAARAEASRLRGRTASGAYVRAALSLLRRPRPGLTVALSGLDGSGKSTQARALVAALGALGEDARLEWDRFGTQDVVAHVALPLKRLLHALSGAEPYRIPPDRTDAAVDQAVSASQDLGRALRQRFGVLNTIWLFFLTAVHTTSLRHRNRVHVRAGRSVVHDRYLLDSVVQLRDHFGDAPGAGVAERLMRIVTPDPDVAVFLDVPATEAFRRKQDFTADELERHRARYLVSAAALGVPVVDGASPPEAVFEELLHRVLAARVLTSAGRSGSRVRLPRIRNRSARATAAGNGSVQDHVWCTAPTA
jgi:thymidylate kinase